jgi:hypothetical protein
VFLLADGKHTKNTDKEYDNGKAEKWVPGVQKNQKSLIS